MIKNKPQDFLPQSEKYNGIYRGVIENNKDPREMGRCQIRIFGMHSDDIDEVPTEYLPWAEPALGLFEGSVTGYGAWTIPLQGSHVFLFFENGSHLQPRYFASVPGKPDSVNHGIDGGGFQDPENRYPAAHRLGEPDFHKLTRANIDGTVVSYKVDNVERSVKKASGGNWDEPILGQEGRQYPNNKVIATHGGIVIEIDDTPDEQRLMIYHPSNTYIEVGADGTMIIKNDLNKFEVVGNDLNELIKNDKNTHINSDSTKYIGNNKKEEVGNNLEQEVSNRSTKKANSYNVEAGSVINHRSGGNHNINASGIVNIRGAMIRLN